MRARPTQPSSRQACISGPTYRWHALVPGWVRHYPREVAMELVVHFRAAVALLGRFPALAGIDLDVAQGQIVLLRGPNGAGKTTFLRACAGLVPVVEGEAEVLGCDLRHDPRAVRRRVGLLGHATGLYDDLTVF